MSDRINLENDLVRFGFDRATGCLAELFDKRTGRSHLTRLDGARLFRVVCPSATWRSRHADTQDCAPPEIVEGDGTLRMHYPRVTTPEGDIDVEVTVDISLPADDTEARFSLELTNHGDDLVHEVRFPWIGGWESYGGRGSDQALAGCRSLDPHPPEGRTLSYNIGGANRRDFHGMEIAMLPFFDLSGPDAGISYISYHRSPILGGFTTENLEDGPDGNSYAFSWASIPFVNPGETWRSPEVGISLHDGSWRTTADRYRDSMADWWHEPPAPERLKSAIGFQVVMLHTFEGRLNYRFREVPDIAETGLKYGVEDLSLWDPIGAIYARPDDGGFWEQFDDSEPLDHLREGIGEAVRMGTNVSTLVNYRLMRANSSIYREVGDHLVQRGLHGTPIVEDWSNISDTHGAHRTKYLTYDSRAICQRSAAFRRMAHEVTEQTMELGFTSLFIDQTFDLNPCFAPDHGHESPSDTPAAVIEWVAEAAAKVRETSPETYLVGENLDVFVAQHINVSWVWMWAALAPEVMRYVLPETVMCWIVDRQPEVMNRAFAFGSFMALTTGELNGTLADVPELGEHVKRLAELRHRTAEFVAHGRFRDTIGLDTDLAPAYVYESEAGLAVVLAETHGEAVAALVSLDPEAHGIDVRAEGSLHRSGGGVEQAGARDAPGSDGRVVAEIELGPLEVAVWTLPRV